jgi:hypothetical protein
MGKAFHKRQFAACRLQLLTTTVCSRVCFHYITGNLYQLSVRRAPRLHIVSALLCRYIPSNCMLKQQNFACKKCSGNRNVHRRPPLHEHVFSREQRNPVTKDAHVTL